MKVGDEVKIIKLVPIDEIMGDYEVGDTFVISKIETKIQTMYLDEKGYGFYEDQLELIDEQ